MKAEHKDKYLCITLSQSLSKCKPQREIYFSLHQAVCYVLTGFKGSECKLPREWRGVNSLTIENMVTENTNKAELDNL